MPRPGSALRGELLDSPEFAALRDALMKKDRELNDKLRNSQRPPERKADPAKPAEKPKKDARPKTAEQKAK